MMPERMIDGRMKNTVTKTDCVVVCAIVDTNTPIASDASTNGNATIASTSRLPRGQNPKKSPERSVDSVSTK